MESIIGYIPRQLQLGDKTVPEAELVTNRKLIVVLAEPGAGKTELLRSIARRLRIEPSRASIFRHKKLDFASQCLVLDALDEVARTDQSAIDEIIVKAKDSGAQKVIFACRASEWDEARTKFLQETFASEPTVVRLLPFNENEQKALFDAHLPDEDFEVFSNETVRFELLPLLGNPQFLLLFADAFVQGGRRFTTKNKIFVDAVASLAIERNPSAGQRDRPAAENIIALGEELFAKLLLAGATGVSLREHQNVIDFPYLQSLSTADSTALQYTISSRLFKPSDQTDQHEPVHRIVAEYCAARYLARRIDDASDLFSLRRCLALVAPNGVVRDELRGLLGWMAALGSQQVQEACITIDPYAVVANGDQSQLTAQSKRLLMIELRELSEIDPYFRRSDSWRRFSVAGFFGADMVEEVRKQLFAHDAVPELRTLLLELLHASDAVGHLVPELRALLRNPEEDWSSRIRSHRLLIDLPTYDCRSDIEALVVLGDNVSLRIATDSVVALGVEALGRDLVLSLMRQLGVERESLRVPNNSDAYHLRYNTVEITNSFDLGVTEWYLDELTGGMNCQCGAAEEYQCKCLRNVSRIVGRLLDRYFVLSSAPHEAERIWRWIKPLIFKDYKSSDKSESVKALKCDDALRQAIQKLAFAGLSEDDDIWPVQLRFQMSQRHSGLQFQKADYVALADYAFESGNTALWKMFWARHNIYAETKVSDDVRRHMRGQARHRPELLKIWSKQERDVRDMLKANPSLWPRRRKKWERKQEMRDEATRVSFKENRNAIAAGAHWGWLKWISDCYLMEPDKLGEFVDDNQAVDRALANCFPFLEEHIPTLSMLAESQKQVTRVLNAASLAYFRRKGHLDEVDRRVLRAIKTDVSGYQGLKEGEAEAFESEIDRQILSGADEVEAYARDFIEPQLFRSSDAYTDVGWLQYKSAFKPLQKKLALEWLNKFPDMPTSARDQLFNICAVCAGRTELRCLIQNRCAALLARTDGVLGAEAARDFWFLRGFFFLDSPPQEIWNSFKENAQSIFPLAHKADRIGHDDTAGWPTLSADKVFHILDSYVGAWPKVYLPSSWGSGDPPGERAYRFLGDVVYVIGRDKPDRSIPVLDKLLSDNRFADFNDELRSIKAAAFRKKALQDFQPPKPLDVVAALDCNCVSTVEDLRAVLVEQLEELEIWLHGAETDPLDVFYENGSHLDENTCRNRIVDRLAPQLAALNLSVEIERHMADFNRCDITVSAMIDGRRRLLVIEVKGQWHPELFNAASAQLYDRYSIHPDAAQQGIYLVLWFGGEEKVGGVKSTIAAPLQHRNAILDEMPVDLHGSVDVVVLDLSRKQRVTKVSGKKPKAKGPPPKSAAALSARIPPYPPL